MRWFQCRGRRYPAADAMVLTRAGAEVVSLALHAFVAIWLSRSIGAEGLGYWAVTQAILRFGGGIIGAGFPPVGSQRVAHRTESPNSAWSTVTTVRLTLAAAAVLLAEIAVVVSPVGDPNIRLLIGLTAPGLLFVAVSSEWLLVAVGRVHAVALARVAGSVAAAGAAIALVRDPDDLPATAVVLLAPLVMSAAVTTTALVFHGAIGRRGLRLPTWSHVRTYRMDAVHYLKADLSVLTYGSIDRIFLYIVATPAVVGLYEAAYKLVQPFSAIAAVVNDSTFLRLAQALGSVRREGETLRLFCDLMFIATVPLGFFLTLFAAPIIATIYGDAFDDSAQYLALLGWSVTVGFLAAALSMPLVAWRRPREFANAQVMGTGSSVVANLLLVPPLLAVGSALAATISRACVAAVAYAGFRRATGYPVLADFLVYAIISACAFGAALLSLGVWHVPDALSATIFVLTYLSLVFPLRWRHHFRRPLPVAETIGHDVRGDVDELALSDVAQDESAP